MSKLTLSTFNSGSRVAVIGASGGIGQAFVTALQGCEQVETIYCFSRGGDWRGKPHKIVASSIDLLDQGSIVAAAETVPVTLDMVIVATGILHEGKGLRPEKSLRDFHSDQFAQVFAVNTTGPAMVAQAFLPLMAKKSKSVFAVLSARVGSISDNQLGGWYAYRASKAALNMIIKNLSIEMGRKNKSAIMVSLHPGTVDSHLSSPFQAAVPEGKLFAPDYAAGQLLSVIDGLTQKDSGSLVAWDGETISF
ncbi:SDR family NAD(P)-dependent oxidoreductase [uncultured Endozoicomonas sp.]|uniref:SDR family NAD(P)-dependent oxidoreductase n=1 Tax=uncultured Endozoicomonas sp. TaxID=432652 RepID=UPI002639901B|nr:SDR family NAD(P)-dependent oxidoreductase [uncultured Endozoicomonas sp.]